MRATKQLIDQRFTFDIILADRVLPGNTQLTRFNQQDNSSSSVELAESVRGLQDLFDSELSEIQKQTLSIERSLNLSEAIYFYRTVRNDLKDRLDEWNNFIERLVRIRFEAVDVKASQKWKQGELTEWRDQVLLEAGVSKLELPEDLASGRALAQLEGEKQLMLRQQLLDALDKLPHLFCQQLLALVSAEVIGLVEWHAKDICVFSRYERVYQFQMRAWPRRKEASPTDRKQMWFANALAGDVDQRLVRTVEHLIDAKRKELDDPSVIIPHHLEKLVESVPDCFKSYMKVVEGMLFREIVIEKTVAHKDNVVAGTEAFLAYEDRPLIHHDPAIVLGPFVLAGWGESDMRAEVYRRSRLQANQVKTRVTHWPWNKKAGMILLAFASLLSMSGEVVLGVVVPSALACLSAFFLGRQFEKSRAVEMGKKLGNNELLSVLAASISGLAILSGFVIAFGWFFIGIVGYFFVALLLVYYIVESAHWDIVE